jgi:hypothetical protein
MEDKLIFGWFGNNYWPVGKITTAKLCNIWGSKSLAKAIIIFIGCIILQLKLEGIEKVNSAKVEGK